VCINGITEFGQDTNSEWRLLSYSDPAPTGRLAIKQSGLGGLID
jgi:hypothetical protein